MRILVAEDDTAVAKFLRNGFAEEQYAVDIARDGDQARFMAIEYDYDLVILDINLPRVNGFQVLTQLRREKPVVPVLVLTGRCGVEDRVRGLDLGADDYLVKPFSFSELSARVRALLRRGDRPVASVLRVADLVLNRIEHQVRRADRRIELTAKEFALLEYLMRNAGRTVTRAMIIEHVWNLNFDGGTNVIEVYVNYLRNKVDEPFHPRLIHTVRGVGYCLSAELEAGA
jgi:heavy metal response regulator